ncbi:MAG: SPOR domain-containing protein [Bacteroidales bacterium]
MEIASYISDLLYRHDCVIVPDFGGFVATYAPAKIHPVTNTFYPPSKNILFNSKLIRDDGLLIDCISQKEGMLYDEAKKMLELEVWQLRSRLERRERVFLKEVGTLQIESEGRIIFEPDGTVNYLEDSFGLVSFVSSPIVRKGFKKRQDSGFVDRRNGSPAERKVLRKIITYATVILFLLAGGWYSIHSGLLPVRPMQQANMAKLPESLVERTSLETMKPDPVPVTIPLKDVDFTKETLEEPEAEVIVNAVPAQEEVVLPLFHIIGGAFSNEANADKLLAALRTKGYSAQRPGLSPSGLHMVSYLATPDKDEALLNLAMIRRDENPSAWLLKR